MRILSLVSDRPNPPFTGSRVRNCHLWPALRRLGVEVTVLGLDPSREAGPGGVTRTADGEFFGPDRPALPVRSVAALTRSYHEWPYATALARRVAALVRTWQPDVVHAEELRMAAYWPARQSAQGRLLRTVTMHNVESDLIRWTGSSPVRWGRAIVEGLHRRSLRGFEASAVRGADIAFAYSEHDARRYRDLYPGAHVVATRNGVDASGILPSPQIMDPRVLWVGSLAYAPNLEGLAWFVDRVLPSVRRSVGVTVVGSRPGPAARPMLARAGIELVESPADLAPHYAAHALSVVPLLHASGTRTKILESLAHERLVVSTAVGAEGLDLTEADGVVVADDPSAFAAAIVRWAEDVTGRAERARAGRRRVLESYDWTVVAKDQLARWSAGERGSSTG